MGNPLSSELQLLRVQLEPATAKLHADVVVPDVRRPSNEMAWVPAIAVLMVLAVLLLWFPLLRAARPAAIAYNEGWNTYWQQAAASGQLLYGAAPGWTIQNYPPLSFHLIGLLGTMFGDMNLAGRGVSLVSLALVCVLSGGIARRLSGSRWAGWYAGLCPLVWIGVFSPNRIAMNDPQFLGMVFELAGFYVYVGRASAMWPLMASAALFALAVFTKHNLIAAPVAVAVQMLLVRDWRGFGVWAGVGAALAAAGLAATMAFDGRFFLAHLLSARAADYITGLDINLGYARLFAPAIVAGAVWSAGHLNRGTARVLAFGWMVATALGVVLLFGHGVDKNILFEALVFNGIVVAVAARAMLAGSDRPAIPAVMLVTIAIWPLVMAPAMLVQAPRDLADLPRIEEDFTAGSELIRSRPGPAWCENLLLCNAAGKPMIFDAYYTLDQIEAGRLPECAVLRQLAAQVPSSVEVGKSSANDLLLPGARLRFTAAFMRTLLAYYTPVLETAEFFVLVPKDGPRLDVGPCR